MDQRLSVKIVGCILHNAQFNAMHNICPTLPDSQFMSEPRISLGQHSTTGGGGYDGDDGGGDNGAEKAF